MLCASRVVLNINYAINFFFVNYFINVHSCSIRQIAAYTLLISPESWCEWQ